jgi:pectin methylesterase-like acyl-CoA thioesterase
VFLTAQSKRYPEQQSGYVFDHCRVTADAGVDRVFLGRPWRWYSTVVFLDSELDAKVSPQGWKEWHAGQTDRLATAFYAEYKSTGRGAAPELRESHSRQLTDAEAEKYKPSVFLVGQDRWNPTR